MGKTYGKSTVYCMLQVSWGCCLQGRGEREGGLAPELVREGSKLMLLMSIQSNADTPSAEDMRPKLSSCRARRLI